MEEEEEEEELEEEEEQVVTEEGERWYWRVEVGREWEKRRDDAEERDILAKEGLEILIEAAIVVTRSSFQSGSAREKEGDVEEGF